MNISRGRLLDMTEKKNHQDEDKYDQKRTDRDNKREKIFFDSDEESGEHSCGADLDEDVKKVLMLTKDLLDKLPADVYEEFFKSDNFLLYEKVMKKYKIDEE